MVNMGNIWDRTNEFLSDNAAALLPIALLGLLAPHSINALLGLAWPAINPVAGAVLWLATVLIGLWGQIAVVALALDPDGGRSRAVAAAAGAFGRALAAMLLVFAAILVLSLPIWGILAANGVTPTIMRIGGMAATDAMADVSGPSATIIVVYAIILAVVVFVAAIRLALIYPVIVAEGGIIAALRRSVALTRGIVWKLIGVWLLFGIVYMVASAAITSATGAIIGLIAGPSSPFGFGNWMIAILSGIVATLFTLVTAAFSAKLYRAVTAREGAATA